MTLAVIATVLVGSSGKDRQPLPTPLAFLMLVLIAVGVAVFWRQRNDGTYAAASILAALVTWQATSESTGPTWVQGCGIALTLAIVGLQILDQNAQRMRGHRLTVVAIVALIPLMMAHELVSDQAGVGPTAGRVIVAVMVGLLVFLLGRFALVVARAARASRSTGA